MRVFLCGGGSSEKTTLVLKRFNEVIDNTKDILYIPLAMDEEKHSYDDCYKWVKEELKDVTYKNIDMVRSFEELKDIDLSNYGSIFIGGGNTYKLLKGLKDYNVFSKLKEYDGVIFGGSAGTIIFGYDINSCEAMDENRVHLEDTKGFDVLFGKSIFAHYTNEWSEEGHIRFTKFLSDYSKNHESVLALPEEDTVFINGDDIEIIGNRPYYEFNNGKRSKFQMLDYMIVESTDKDKDYIDGFASKLNSISKEIIDFFEISKLSRKMPIMLYDSLEEFRKIYKDFGYNLDDDGNTPLWVCGFSHKGDVHVLCLDEYKKTFGHEDATSDNLLYLILHEFVHSCHGEFANINKCYKWISEGVATTISHQRDNDDMIFDSDLDGMMYGLSNYQNYHTMFKHVLDTYGKDYVLKLIKDSSFMESETPKLYEEVNNIYGKGKNK